MVVIRSRSGGKIWRKAIFGLSNALDRMLVGSANTGYTFDAAREHTARRVACFHCGEPCLDDSCSRNGKAFCCQGCLTVHDILNESSLGHFYDLNGCPGVRGRPAAEREHWAYLDEPALQQRLLDFTDGKTSRITFHIPVIHCVACVWLLENLFRLHPGIGGSQVNFPKREAAISFAPDKIKLSELVALLASIGYEPALTLGELERQKPNTTHKRQWLQIGIAGFAFGNVMLLSLPRYLGLDSFSGSLFKLIFDYLSLALAVPVVFYSSADYWKSALLSLRQRTLTLDVPIALGLAALYVQSIYEIVSGHGEGYLDSLTGLVFFLLCGRIFQQKTYDRLAFDRDYKSFFPLSVTRKGGAGSSPPAVAGKLNGGAHGVTRPLENEARVSISQLEVGDHIVVRNRELIPADARLVSEQALVDYSFVTGESEPVAKKTGDYLYAGGQQIGSAIEIETVKPVSQSYLTSLWSHEAFQKNRDEDLNTVTNRYSHYFTLTVIAVAASAAMFWIASDNLLRGFKAFTSVLIVACPCALALAAPFALGTIQRWLAPVKVFVKNALVLERMAKADSIVFDKTGTLTASGSNTVVFDGTPLSQEEKSWILSLACHSTHPLSVRISETLAEWNLPEMVWSFAETPGSGITGQVQGHKIRLGSASWLESRGIAIKRGSPERSPSQGSGSEVHVAIDGHYRGTFAVSSSLRPETDRLLHELSERYEIALLSGDNETEREQFRSLFGNDARLNFNQSPFDKLGFVKRLQQSGKTVIMVGDGLNDAGALKQSDVGIAIIEKTGAFSPASDVILEANRVPRLTEILALARRSVRIVKISFAISALYNVVGVGFAATGILSPMICAVLMPLSSISVVLFACSAATWAARTVRTNGAFRMGIELHQDEEEALIRNGATNISDNGFHSSFAIRHSSTLEL